MHDTFYKVFAISDSKEMSCNARKSTSYICISHYSCSSNSSNTQCIVFLTDLDCSGIAYNDLKYIEPYFITPSFNLPYYSNRVRLLHVLYYLFNECNDKEKFTIKKIFDRIIRLHVSIS